MELEASQRDKSKAGRSFKSVGTPGKSKAAGVKTTVITLKGGTQGSSARRLKQLGERLARIEEERAQILREMEETRRRPKVKVRAPTAATVVPENKTNFLDCADLLNGILILLKPKSLILLSMSSRRMKRCIDEAPSSLSLW
jgi:hypothetical protein